MTISEIKIERLQPEKLRNMIERIQKIKKSRAINFDFPFSFRHIFGTVSEIKIQRLKPEKLRNIFEQIQKMKKSQTIVFHSLFPISSRVFAVEYFGIRHWKANGKTNLMTVSEIKIERLQSEKLRNMFERI